ncbi:MAG TPA: hypothetical protein VJU18_08060 [Vicinamibacteria bacterium]|nr:hypothetical protein [Vicinamibacteria bacterium]
MTSLDDLLAEAVLGIDTLWGGDVMNPSGTGRFIADSWFSDRALPQAYTHQTAARVRGTGGVSAKQPDQAAIDAYLKAVDVHGAIEAVAGGARSLGGLRGAYLESLALCFEVMWDLVKEILGRGDPVPYERAVRASTGAPPTPSDPDAKRRLVAGLLREAGFPIDSAADMVSAADAWRRRHAVAADQIPALAASCIAALDGLTERHLVPHLPEALALVPRANIRFLPIKDAWFSGSMNYLGRARTPQGRPEFEATYEINASLQISEPEFRHLVSHEVVPGHVTTFAILQDLFWRGEVGFEASVLTMNTRGAALFEGIANNAILIAHGVTEVKDLPDPDLQIGVILALLQDDAKNEASYLTWQEGVPQEEVARRLRMGFLVSEERADKLSGAWGRHPLLGRMHLPAYRAGTEAVARLRRHHPPETVLPALYGCRGLVDVVTLNGLLDSGIA